MDTQTIFQAGNSLVVSIPKSLINELGIKSGQKVEVGRIPETDEIVIMTKPTKKKSTRAVQVEFKKWLDSFLNEDGQLLDELATR